MELPTIPFRHIQGSELHKEKMLLFIMLGNTVACFFFFSKKIYFSTRTATFHHLRNPETVKITRPKSFTPGSCIWKTQVHSALKIIRACVTSYVQWRQSYRWVRSLSFARKNFTTDGILTRENSRHSREVLSPNNKVK